MIDNNFHAALIVLFVALLGTTAVAYRGHDPQATQATANVTKGGATPAATRLSAARPLRPRPVRS